MLRTLKVRDLAIIDELELVLEPGLNVITGETGAGKSILLQALDAALGRVESHRELLDAIGGLVGAVEEMRRRHARLQAASQAVAERREAERTAAERVELLRFQASELAGARLVPGEEEALGVERGRLTHAERLAGLVAAAEAGIYSADASAVGSLGRARGALAESERLDAGL